MCEEECVSVLVPLSFPHYCETDENMEESVLENVEELDAVAEIKISEMNNNNYDDINLYASYTPYEYPEWWVLPGDDSLGISTREVIDLDDECTSIARLLNEDEFRQDIKSLATQGLFNFLGMDADDFQVQKAIVSSVGPMGMCLRAKAKKRSRRGS